jgi:hypothetical protein
MNTLLALRGLDVTWMEKIGDGSSGALGVSELAHDAKTSRTLQTSLLATRRSDCNRGGISRAPRSTAGRWVRMARQAGHLGAAEVGKAGI